MWVGHVAEWHWAIWGHDRHVLFVMHVALRGTMDACAHGHLWRHVRVVMPVHAVCHVGMRMSGVAHLAHRVGLLLRANSARALIVP